MSAVFQINGWQSGFLQVLPAVQTHAQIRFRHLPAVHRQEAVQECIAAACQSYQLLAAKGRLDVARPSTLATYAVRHVQNGRHVGGHQDSARDPLSPVAQRRHGVRVVSLDSRRGIGRSTGWRQVAVEGRRADVPELAAFRVDFAEWLRMLTRRDRKIISAMATGERTKDLAERFRLSQARISQLRGQYERMWNAFQGQTTAFSRCRAGSPA
jgi:hypothetical protein